MKNFQVIILVVFGLLALVGLVVFATSKGVGGGSAAVGAVNIWGLLPQESMDATLAELAASDKRYAEVRYSEIDAANFGAELAQAIAEGKGPDLVIITQEQIISEAPKLSIIPYATYPERTFIDSFVPMSDLFMAADGVYGIPLAVDPLVLFYNRQALNGAGVPSAPSTWEAVNGLAETLTQGNAATGLTKSVIPFGGYANVRNARAALSLILFQAGIPVSRATEFGVDAALAGEGDVASVAAQAAVDFYTQFANPAKTVYSWNGTLPNSRDAFLAGDLVFYPGFASERSYLAAANPNLDFDLAAIPQPSVADTRMTYGLMYAAALPRASLNPTGAMTVALALSEAGTSAFLSSAAYMAPARRGLLTPPADDRFAAIVFPEALRARGWLSPAPSVTDGIFAGMIGNVTSGRKSVPDSLEAANQSLDAALR